MVTHSTITTLKILVGVASLFLLSFPTNFRIAFVVISLCLVAAELFCIALIRYCSRNIQATSQECHYEELYWQYFELLDRNRDLYPENTFPKVPGCPFPESTEELKAMRSPEFFSSAGIPVPSRNVQLTHRHPPALPPPANLWALGLQGLNMWIFLQQVREKLGNFRNRGSSNVFWTAVVILFVVYLVFLMEFIIMVSKQNAFYSADVLDSWNGNSAVTQVFPGTSRLHTSVPKILMIVLDGFRYDAMEDTTFQQFLAKYNFPSDGKIFHSEAALPSMSVPNWVTLMTGALPEITGVLGNVLIPPTKFDNLFKEASRFSLPNGLTGSTWWGDIFHNDMPFLGGANTVPADFGVSGGIFATSANPADEERTKVTLEALTQSPAYNFFLCHFSDIDFQGHAFGVSPRYNRHNTYFKAVANRTRDMDTLLSSVDDNTLVIITSDHGHVDRGGHGGVSEVLRDTPLLAWRRNSNLASAQWSGPQFSRQQIRNIDLAPTLCALLGIAVPRQTNGQFVLDLLAMVQDNTLQLQHLRDLFYQKRALVSQFFTATSADTPSDFGDFFAASYDDPAVTGASGYISAIDRLTTMYEDRRNPHLGILTLRNVLTSLLILAFVMAFVLVLVKNTSVDPFFLFRRPSRPYSWKNLWALIIAFFNVMGFCGLALSVFLLLYVRHGFWDIAESTFWDSTYIHTPSEIPRMIFYSWSSAIIFTVLAMRCYKWFFTPWKSLWRLTSSKVRAVFRIAVAIFLSRDAVAHGRVLSKFNNPIMVYLIRHYTILWLLSAQFLLSLLSSSYAFVIPTTFHIQYITEENWQLRFRVMTLQFMLLLYTIGAMWDLYDSFSDPPDRLSFDQDALILMQLRHDEDSMASKLRRASSQNGDSGTSVRRDKKYLLLEKRLYANQVAQSWISSSVLSYWQRWKQSGGVDAGDENTNLAFAVNPCEAIRWSVHNLGRRWFVDLEAQDRRPYTIEEHCCCKQSLHVQELHDNFGEDGSTSMARGKHGTPQLRLREASGSLPPLVPRG